jgi:hypothetical protein
MQYLRKKKTKSKINCYVKLLKIPDHKPAVERDGSGWRMETHHTISRLIRGHIFNDDVTDFTLLLCSAISFTAVSFI